MILEKRKCSKCQNISLSIIQSKESLAKSGKIWDAITSVVSGAYYNTRLDTSSGLTYHPGDWTYYRGKIEKSFNDEDGKYYDGWFEIEMTPEGFLRAKKNSYLSDFLRFNDYSPVIGIKDKVKLYFQIMNN